MASIQIKFFASLREVLDTDVMQLTLNDEKTVADLLLRLCDELDGFKSYYDSQPILVAVNQTMAEMQHPIKEKDEVALFPPVTGG